MSKSTTVVLVESVCAREVAAGAAAVVAICGLEALNLEAGTASMVTVCARGANASGVHAHARSP